MANVSVTYQDMRSAGKRLTDGREEIEENLQNLKRLVADLVAGGYVTDSSSKAFQSSYDSFTKGASETIEGLVGMSEYLKSAADTFEEADSKLASALK
jgi:WXG100 family type VII secretion target